MKFGVCLVPFECTQFGRYGKIFERDFRNEMNRRNPHEEVGKAYYLP